MLWYVTSALWNNDRLFCCGRHEYLRPKLPLVSSCCWNHCTHERTFSYSCPKPLLLFSVRLAFTNVGFTKLVINRPCEPDNLFMSRGASVRFRRWSCDSQRDIRWDNVLAYRGDVTPLNPTVTVAAVCSHGAKPSISTWLMNFENWWMPQTALHPCKCHIRANLLILVVLAWRPFSLPLCVFKLKTAHYMKTRRLEKQLAWLCPK